MSNNPGETGIELSSRSQQSQFITLSVNPDKITNITFKDLPAAIKDNQEVISSTIQALKDHHETIENINQRIEAAQTQFEKAQQEANSGIRSYVGGRSIKLSDAEQQHKTAIEGLENQKNDILETIRAQNAALEYSINFYNALIEQKIKLTNEIITEKTNNIMGLESTLQDQNKALLEKQSLISIQELGLQARDDQIDAQVLSIAEIRNSLEESQKQVTIQESKIEGTNQKIIDYQTNKSELQSQLNREDENLENKIEKSAQKRDTKIEEAKSDYTDAFNGIHSDFQVKINAIQAAYTQVKDNENPTLPELKEAKETADNALNELNQQTKTLLKGIKDIYGEAIQGAYQGYVSDVHTAKEDYSKAIEPINKKIEENEIQFAQIIPEEMITPIKLREKTLEKIDESIKKNHEEIAIITAQLTETTKDLEILTKIQEAKEAVAEQQIKLQEAMIEKLQSSNAELQRNLETTQGALESAQNTINAQNALIAQLQLINQQLRDEIELQKKQQEALRIELEAAKNTIGELSGQLDRLKTQHAELKAQTAEQIKQLESQQHEIDDLKNELLTAKRQIASLESEVSRLTNQLSASDDKIKALTQEKDALENKLKESQEKLATKQNELDNTPKDSIEHARTSLKTYLENANRSVSAEIGYYESLYALNDTHLELRLSLLIGDDLYLQTRDDISNKIKELNKFKEELKDDIRKLTTPTPSIQSLTDVVSHYKYNRPSFPDEPLLQTIKANINAQNKIRELTEQKARVDNELSSTKDLSENLSLDITSKRSEIDKIKAENLSLQERIGELNEANAELLRAKNENVLLISSQSIKIDNLENELSSEKSSYASLQEQLTKTGEQIASIQESLDAGQEEINNLKNSLAEKNRENDTLRLELANKVEELQNAQETLQDKVDKLISEQTVLPTKIAFQQEQIKTLDQEIKELEHLVILQSTTPLIESEKTKLNNELSTVDSELARLNDTKAKLELYSSLQTQLTNLDENAPEEERSRIEDEIDSLTSQMPTLNTMTLEKITQEIEAKTLEKTEIVNKINDADKLLENNQSEIDVLTARFPEKTPQALFDEKSSQRERLQENLDGLQARYDDNLKEINSASEKLADYKQEINGLKHQMTDTAPITSNDLVAQQGNLQSLSEKLENTRSLSSISNLSEKWGMKLFNVEFDQNSSAQPSNQSGTINIPNSDDNPAVYSSGIQLKHRESGLSYTFKLDPESNTPKAILGPMPSEKDKITACVMNVIDNILANGNEVNLKTSNPLVAAITEEYLGHLRDNQNLKIKSSIELTTGSSIQQPDRDAVKSSVQGHFSNDKNSDILSAMKEKCSEPQAQARRLSNPNTWQANTTLENTSNVAKTEVTNPRMTGPR